MKTDCNSQVGEKQKVIMQKVMVSIPRSYYNILYKYSQGYHVCGFRLMEYMAFAGLETLGRCMFGALEDFQEMTRNDNVNVELTFCDQTYSLFERAAKLLRRPVSELIGYLVLMEVDDMTFHIGPEIPLEATNVHWAKDAINFAVLAKLGEFTDKLNRAGDERPLDIFHYGGMRDPRVNEPIAS